MPRRSSGLDVELANLPVSKGENMPTGPEGLTICPSDLANFLSVRHLVRDNSLRPAKIAFLLQLLASLRTCYCSCSHPGSGAF